MIPRVLRLYVPLVGVPLLALIGVLHAGEHLSAPPSLRGDWLVRAGAPAAAPAGKGDCAAQSITAVLHRVSISQSGPHLELTLLDADGSVVTRTQARIDGDSATSDVIGGQSCSERLTLRFDGRIPNSLRGAFTMTDCGDCAEPAFTAVRRHRPPQD